MNDWIDLRDDNGGGPVIRASDVVSVFFDPYGKVGTVAIHLARGPVNEWTLLDGASVKMKEWVASRLT